MIEIINAIPIWEDVTTRGSEYAEKMIRGYDVQFLFGNSIECKIQLRSGGLSDREIKKRIEAIVIRCANKSQETESDRIEKRLNDLGKQISRTAITANQLIKALAYNNKNP